LATFLGEFSEYPIYSNLFLHYKKLLFDASEIAEIAFTHILKIRKEKNIQQKKQKYLL
jgi:hypothetical protein